MIGFFDILSAVFGGLDSKDVEELRESAKNAQERGDGRRLLIVALTVAFGLAMLALGIFLVFR